MFEKESYVEIFILLSNVDMRMKVRWKYLYFPPIVCESLSQKEKESTELKASNPI